MKLNDVINEAEKVRLDPKCWTGKKIGNPKTKVKGGVRVNNCVPAESVAEGSLNEGQYEMMMRNGQVKKFIAKDDADAKRIAAGHGAKSVIKLRGGVPAGKVSEQGVAEGIFGLSSKEKAKIQYVTAKISDIPGNWDHKNQQYTERGLADLKSVMKNEKYLKYALSLTADDYEAEGVAEARVEINQDAPDNLYDIQDNLAMSRWKSSIKNVITSLFAKRYPGVQLFFKNTQEGNLFVTTDKTALASEDVGLYSDTNEFGASIIGPTAEYGVDDILYVGIGFDSIKSGKYKGIVGEMLNTIVPPLAAKFKAKPAIVIVVEDQSAGAWEAMANKLGWAFISGEDEQGMAEGLSESLVSKIEELGMIGRVEYMGPNHKMPYRATLQDKTTGKVWYQDFNGGKEAEDWLANNLARYEQWKKNKQGVAEGICSIQEANAIFDDFERSVAARGLTEDIFDTITDEQIIAETAAWRRKEGKSAKGGLNAKGVASYRRENPGSKLQMAVTTKPSKLKPGSKAAKRRKSFCARMSGVKGPMKKPNGKPTRKALALRKWNC